MDEEEYYKELYELEEQKEREREYNFQMQKEEYIAEEERHLQECRDRKNEQ